jgi:hypothetical protein
MAIMYLLDPESGQGRRRMIAKTAREKYETASDALWSAADSARDSISPSRFSDYSDAARKSGRRAYSRLSSLGSDLADSATDTADNASETVSDSMGSFRDYLNSFGSRVARRARDAMPSSFSMGRRRSRSWRAAPIAGYTAGGMGLVALGAGVAFLFDPARGRGRRAYLRDQFFALTNDVGDFMFKMGRHFSNQVQGSVAETRSYFRGDEPSDLQLAERVRSQLGRISGASAVDVRTTNGNVTLCSTGSSPLSQETIDEITRVVNGIRGVRSVDCQFSGASQSQTAPMM